MPKSGVDGGKHHYSTQKPEWGLPCFRECVGLRLFSSSSR
jgi:hypothetical protein